MDTSIGNVNWIVFKGEDGEGKWYVSGSKSVRKRDGKLGENGDGFWLRFKRLEKGHFRWPQPGSEATITLSAEELGILLGGAKVELKLRRNEVLERRAI